MYVLGTDGLESRVWLYRSNAALKQTVVLTAKSPSPWQDPSVAFIFSRAIEVSVWV